ncbi:MAG: dihydrolipoyl dehydrogenase [Candidatus Adiutrix sp.]
MKLAVIGGGPGGYVAAIRAAQLGAQVTLIEKEALGGTCLNVGCIPTKALLHTAELLDEAKKGATCGVMTNVTLDFPKAMAHKQSIVKKLVLGVTGLLAANKVQVIVGTASFHDKNSLTITSGGPSQTLSFDKIIIATGSLPAKPPILGIESKQCLDSTGALSLPTVPASMIIIGGGVIGVEIATMYNAMGSKITIIEMMDEILPMMDKELTQIVKNDLVKKGVEIFTKAQVTSISDSGQAATVATTMADGSSKNFSAEKVLVAVGRKTATESLNMDKVGLKHQNGRIIVNEKMETNLSGVYAAGDCLGQIMLAHIASAQGEIAAENALGHSAIFDAKTNPSCVYTNPEFAGVGLTEEEAKAQNVPYIMGKFPLMANGKALIMGGDNGLIKILFGQKHKEVLGVHIVGPRATDLIAQGALALGLEATADEIIATIFAHPTVGEAVREAALAALNRAIHIPNKTGASS